jgi:hypothetical protein
VRVVIVLWGAGGDAPLAAVHAALQRRRRAVGVVDQRDPMDTTMELSVQGDVGGWLKFGKKKVDLADVVGVYVRPHDPGDLPEVRAAGPTGAAWRHARALHAAMCAWTEIAAARVIHPLSAMAPNGSKPHQARLIREAGFRVPCTLVTTDPAAALEFRDRHGDVIYKSTSGVRSVVARLTGDKLDRLDRVRRCPVQFQEYVAGVDHRVHVIGEDVFACAVEHDELDYRVTGARLVVHEIELPDADAERCAALARSLDLQLAGIDLRRTPDGEWVCFEVNPSPAFTHYETKPGQLADSVARLLAEKRAS